MSLDEKLAELRTVVTRLNEESDGVNQRLFQEYEAALKDMGCGVTVTVDGIGFAKLSNQWQLVHDDGTGTIKPLRDAPRHIRVRAVEMLPRLTMALTERAQEMLAAIHTALHG